jgi:hypothetical protein
MVLFSVIVDNPFANNNIVRKKVKFLFGFVDKTAKYPSDCWCSDRQAATFDIVLPEE